MSFVRLLSGLPKGDKLILMIYFEKRACWEIDWDEGESVQQMKENSVMKNAYVHYLFEQVTTAIKNSSEVYSEENAPWK